MNRAQTGSDNSPWHTLRADVESWQMMNPMNEKYPDPPAWWNVCEKCKRTIAATEAIGVEVMFGLPNAVYCEGCS